MLISCPRCETQFDVPEDALGAKGRTLKCARCGHKWFQTAPGAELAPPPPAPEPEPEPEPEQPHLLPGFEDFKFGTADFAPERADLNDDLTEERAPDFLDEEMPAALSPRAPRRTPEPGRRRRGSGAAFLWTVAIGLAVVGILGGATYMLQDEIARLFPWAGQAMQSAGLRDKVVGEGLQIRNQRVERLIEGTREVLIIRGVIANVSDRPRDVPWVRAVLLDDKNVAVMDKMTRAPVDGLDAGATTVFTIRMESPHPDAKHINLVFAPPPTPKG